MQRVRSSDQISTFSLAKSKQMLDHLTHKVSSIQSNRENTKVIQFIQHSSKKIQQGLQSKIQQHFNQMLNSPTLMPLSKLKPFIGQKQNQFQSSLSALDGAKSLMHHYWEKNKKNVDLSNKQVVLKTTQIRRSQKLPQIGCYNRDNKLAAYIKAKQKQKQIGIGFKQEQPLEQYHININIIDYKCQNDGKIFLAFQKRYYKRWQQIQFILKSLQKFAEHYQLLFITVKTLQIFQLIEKVRSGEKISPHDLLKCCENAEKISEQNSKKSGIRFFGNKGIVRAAIIIQSHVKKWFQIKKYSQLIKKWRCAKKIQNYYRSYKLYVKMKKQIFQRQMEKLEKFNQIQKKFIENYRKRQLASRIRYEIHIPSHNLSDLQKLSQKNYLQKQNGQLCRIFKIAQKSLLTETHVIYVSPIQLSKDLINYYKKLIELGSQEKIEDKFTIISPEYDAKLPINISLTQQLYYSTKTIKKIKKMIGNNYAFIVPSNPSNDYINLCYQLNLPLYSNNPQKLLYLQTKSGCKSIIQLLPESKDQGFGILPYTVDIYTESNLLNQLTNLIYRYPYVKRWVLKIDNQKNSRGIAYIDISKIINKKLLKKLVQQNNNTSKEKIYRQEIYNILQSILIANNQQRIIIIDKQFYSSQSQFLRFFYTRGGIIQASINNFQTDLQNTCFTVNIEPDGQWRFISSYYKITNKNKCLGAYFDSNSLHPPLQINHIVQKLKIQKYFGYFTFQFLSIPNQQQKTMKRLQNKLMYLNAIDCHLDSLSSAYFLKDFISKESNALFIPILEHPCLKQLRLQTFFHLCRLQNISFDIQKRIGNVFMFLNGLESSCIGIMTFNPQSKQDCYTHIAEVLDFLNSKIKQGTVKNIPESFYAIKNVVNGFINRSKKLKIVRSQKKLDIF